MKYLSHLLSLVCLILLLSGCKIQPAPGAYEIAKSQPAAAKVEEEKQPEKPIEQPKNEKIIFEAEKPKPQPVQPKPEVIDTPKVVEPAPVVEKEVTRSEQFVVVEPEQESQVKKYSVVIGSFGKQDNAKGLKARMAGEGYDPIIVLNDKGMYRVLLVSYDDYASAKNKIAEVKNQFSDAWVLVPKQ